PGAGRAGGTAGAPAVRVPARAVPGTASDLTRADLQDRRQRRCRAAASLQVEPLDDPRAVVDTRPHCERERYPEEAHPRGVEVDAEPDTGDRPGVVDQQGLQREHLEDHLVLAELLGSQDDAVLGSNAAQSSHRELAE